jgi:hypothetical protein
MTSVELADWLRDGDDDRIRQLEQALDAGTVGGGMSLPGAGDARSPPGDSSLLVA